MKTNNSGLQIIKDCEGLKLKSYLCPSDVWTIGYGTTVYPNGVKVKLNEFCTAELASNFLAFDVTKTESFITKKVKVDLTENQFSALVSLVYNIGSGNFSKSTLLKKLNAGDYEEASEQFLVWRKSRGKVLRGLEIRRAKEKELFDSQS